MDLTTITTFIGGLLNNGYWLIFGLFLGLIADLIFTKIVKIALIIVLVLVITGWTASGFLPPITIFGVNI